MSNGVCFSSDGNSGGMGFFWIDINVNLVSYLRNYFMVKVCDYNNQPLWMAVGIYGYSKSVNKYFIWQFMQDLKSVYKIFMFFLGDFNEICSSVEKDDGVGRRESDMDVFYDIIDDCGFFDMGFSGFIFT